MVHEYVVHDEKEVLEIMKSEAFDPLNTVLLEEDPGVAHLDIDDDFMPGSAQLKAYRPSRITCQTRSENSGFLVLADNWHPDWQVFVDGERSDLLLANHTFRAVHVQKGTHEVVFQYVSWGFATGSVISIIALLLALGICIITYKYRI
jgi:hypothetical protein